MGPATCALNGTGSVQLGNDAGTLGGNNYTGETYAATTTNSQCQLNGLASLKVSLINLRGSESGQHVEPAICYGVGRQDSVHLDAGDEYQAPQLLPRKLTPPFAVNAPPVPVTTSE